MAGVGNLVLGYLPDLVRQQRDDGNGMSRQCHEFHRAAFAAFVNEHSCTDVARAQAVLMSVWRTCWQRCQNAVDFLSRLLRQKPTRASPTSLLIPTTALHPA